MHSKSLLIAIAAFAVTTTGVHAYGGVKTMQRAGLNESQVQAIQEARELKLIGHDDEARKRLVQAGVDAETLEKLKRMAKETLSDIHAALIDDDFESFIELIKESPLADIISSKTEYNDFRDAYLERQASRLEKNEEKINDRGERLKKPMHHRHHQLSLLFDLNESQREAYLVAKEANDRATMQAILDEAGIEKRIK
jgi:hypothetical protein